VNFVSPEQEAIEREYYEKHKNNLVDNRNRPPYKTHNKGKKQQAVDDSPFDGAMTETKNNGRKKSKANNQQFAKRIPKYVKKNDSSIANNDNNNNNSNNSNANGPVGRSENSTLLNNEDTFDDIETKKRKVEK
jgi:hypothetical protein